MLLYSEMVDVHSKVHFSSFQSLSAFSWPYLFCCSREQWFPENVGCGSWSGHSGYAVHLQKGSSASHGVNWKVFVFNSPCLTEDTPSFHYSEDLYHDKVLHFVKCCPYIY